MSTHRWKNFFRRNIAGERDGEEEDNVSISSIKQTTTGFYKSNDDDGGADLGSIRNSRRHLYGNRRGNIDDCESEPMAPPPEVCGPVPKEQVELVFVPQVVTGCPTYKTTLPAFGASIAFYLNNLHTMQKYGDKPNFSDNLDNPPSPHVSMTMGNNPTTVATNTTSNVSQDETMKTFMIGNQSQKQQQHQIVKTGINNMSQKEPPKETIKTSVLRNASKFAIILDEYFHNNFIIPFIRYLETLVGVSGQSEDYVLKIVARRQRLERILRDYFQGVRTLCNDTEKCKRVIACWITFADVCVKYVYALMASDVRPSGPTEAYGILNDFSLQLGEKLDLEQFGRREDLGQKIAIDDSNVLSFSSAVKQQKQRQQVNGTSTEQPNDTSEVQSNVSSSGFIPKKIELAQMNANMKLGNTKTSGIVKLSSGVDNTIPSPNSSLPAASPQRGRIVVPNDATGVPTPTPLSKIGASISSYSTPVYEVIPSNRPGYLPSDQFHGVLNMNGSINTEASLFTNSPNCLKNQRLQLSNSKNYNLDDLSDEFDSDDSSSEDSGSDDNEFGYSNRSSQKYGEYGGSFIGKIDGELQYKIGKQQKQTVQLLEQDNDTKLPREINNGTRLYHWVPSKPIKFDPGMNSDINGTLRLQPIGDKYDHGGTYPVYKIEIKSVISGPKLISDDTQYLNSSRFALLSHKCGKCDEPRYASCSISIKSINRTMAMIDRITLALSKHTCPDVGAKLIEI